MERGATSIVTGVRRTLPSHVANTTLAQTTTSSAPTPHSGRGRVATCFIIAGVKQLWAGDALVPLSTAATPGTHQLSIVMRYKEI